MRFDPIECGMRIKSLREEKGLTQVELSEQFRISLDHLKAIERGRRACSIDLFIEAAIAFNVSLDYLILGRTVTLDSIRVYLKTQNCTKRQEKDIKGFYHRQYKEVIA